MAMRCSRDLRAGDRFTYHGHKYECTQVSTRLEVVTETGTPAVMEVRPSRQLDVFDPTVDRCALCGRLVRLSEDRIYVEDHCICGKCVPQILL